MSTGLARRRCRAAILLAVVAVAGLAHGQVPEYEAKAEFLERFTRFIDWPAGSSPEAPGAPFVIGVLGTDPFGRYLDALASRPIKGKSVEIRRLGSSAEASACHLVFIAGSEARRLEKVLAETADRPVLTVGDTEGFAERGVIINLVRESDRLGFEVNEEAARKAGLRLNSKLLRLAHRVGSS